LPHSGARDCAFKTFKFLSDLSKVNADKDDDERPFLRFSEDAQKFFNGWLCDMMKELRSGKIEHPILQSHFTKYRKLVPALSLVFHLCDEAEKLIKNGSDGFDGSVDAVSLNSVIRACGWFSYLWEHAQRIYGLAIGYSAIKARTIALKLQSGALQDGFTAKQLWVKNWSGLDSSDAVKEPLDYLEGLGWIRSVEIRNPAGGRPTVQYKINPRIKDVKL
jgi:Protein of unknown function (DUF3987)